MISESMLGEFQYYFFFGLGLVLSFAALYLGVRTKYEEWEENVQTGIKDYANQLYDYLDRMFLRQPLKRCYGMILGSTIFFGVLGLLFGLPFGLMGSAVGAVALSVLGFKLPGIVIKFLFDKRVEKFDSQLSDALNMMSNAIKSGLSFMQVIQLLEKELPNPASQEFAMVLKENRIGVSLNDALMNMTKRIPSADLFMIMNSVVTLSQQGGDLSEAFETIAFTIRERQKVSEKIKTLAAQGTMQAIVLSSLPFVMMGILYVVQPDLMMLLFTTTLGNALLVMMLLLIALGILWMKKILTVEI